MSEWKEALTWWPVALAVIVTSGVWTAVGFSVDLILAGLLK